MARGRLISKSLGSSRAFHALLTVGGKLGEFCQVLYPLVVVNTDDFGRMPGDAFTVKNVVLPSSRRPESDFDRALNVMHEVGLIVRYEANGSIYLQVNKFDEHQPGLHKRTASKFPAIPESPGNSRKFPEIPPEEKRTEGNRREGKGTGTALTREADDLFPEFWEAYPKKKAKEEARKAWNKRRPDRALLDVMLHALSIQRLSSEWLKAGGQYIPNPATWLNGARWTDVVDVEIAGDGLSDTARHNLAAIDGMQQLLLAREAGREH